MESVCLTDNDRRGKSKYMACLKLSNIVLFFLKLIPMTWAFPA